MASTTKKSFGYYLSVGLLRGLNLLPYSWVARFGAGLGRLLYAIPSSRKRVVHTNLRLCFPHWDDATRERVAKASFVHAIRSYAERSVQWFADGKKLERLIEVDSAVDLKAPDMPPTILLGFHFVGIEMASVFINYLLDRPCASLYTPMSNPAMQWQSRRRRARSIGPASAPRPPPPAACPGR